MKTTKTLLTFGACLLTAGSSWAAEVWLRAAETTITLPNGTTAGRQVKMWGFAKDSNGTANDGTVTVPGPAIIVPTNDPNLTIHLKNYLPEPVSIVIPGQLGGVLGDPSTFTDAAGRLRAKSLTHEAVAVDTSTTGTPIPGTADYVWNNIQAGTYLYHSGSHMAVQVKMGLYGAMTKIHSFSGPNSFAYQGVDYRSEVTLLFSEVDVDLNDAVAGGTYGPVPGSTMSSVSRSEPEYFLINGVPYTDGQVPTSLGVPNQAALLRFLNAGHDTHIPIMNGLHLQVVAENGKPYLDRKSAYAVNLPAMQTVDARLPAAPLGVHAVYDRRLGLSDAANASGGMLTYVAVGQSQQRGNAITIPNGPGNASTYPAPINYTWPAGTAGTVGKVTVTLQNFYHARPQDVDILLVSPALAGQPAKSVLLMSDAGGTTAIPNTTAGRVTLTFDDAASAPLTTSQLVTGTYKSTDLPANAGDQPTTGLDSFPTAPQPSGPYSTSLSDFNGLNPNGQWRLYIRDDQGSLAGGLANGWSITIAPKR